MIKVLHLLNHVSRKTGGLYTSVQSLSKALHVEGVGVSVLGLEDELAAEDIPKWQPVPANAMKIIGPRRFYYSPQLLPAIIQSAPDILHSHGIWHYPSLAVNRVFKRKRTPYLVTTHGMLDPWALGHSRWKKQIAGWLFENAHLRNAVCLSALCESEAQSIRAYGVKNPICVIPNGTDLPEIGNRKSGIGNPPWAGVIEPGRNILLYLGRLDPKKNLPNLVRAWAAAVSKSAARARDWALVIAGTDRLDHTTELKALTCELGLEKKIYFIGPQYDEAKIAALHAASAFVLPSLSEGLPMSVLEAWSYGLPVVMTPECNLPEGFAAGAAIEICPEPDAIARGLLTLLEMSASERTAMGQKGRMLVEERFNWHKIASDMRAVYEWILGGGPAPASVRLT
jgi:poly(glycerol-phosphate) alpha-glucosyltransferase